MNKKTFIQYILTIIILPFLFCGCSGTYYAAMEKLGKEKRHLLVDKVTDVRDSQKKAQEDFRDALTRIRDMYGINEEKLESMYDNLASSYEDCHNRAQQINDRVVRVKRLAKDLFSEWEGEILEINELSLKNSSRKSLQNAKKRYGKLEKTMEKSIKSMQPVLTKLKDYTLYLKHNLNAMAVGALGGEMLSIEKEVARLIKDMDISINEADQFIKNFSS